MANIGERVKSRRLDLNLTQEELAHKVGYKSKSTINKIELGINELKQKHIKAFADALQTTPYWLLGIDEHDYDYSNNLDAELGKIIRDFDDSQMEMLITYARFLRDNH